MLFCRVENKGDEFFLSRKERKGRTRFSGGPRHTPGTAGRTGGGA